MFKLTQSTLGRIMRKEWHLGLTDARFTSLVPGLWSQGQQAIHVFPVVEMWWTYPLLIKGGLGKIVPFLLLNGSIWPQCSCIQMWGQISYRKVVFRLSFEVVLLCNSQMTNTLCEGVVCRCRNCCMRRMQFRACNCSKQLKLH